MPRRANQETKDLIKSFEGLRLKAYKDVVGVLTIGYGHTGDVKPGSVITEHQADAILDVDLDKFERGVEELTEGVPLTDNEFGALVSLAFNIGLGAFSKSTLLLKLRHGAPRDFCATEFLKWRMAGGKVYPGLVRRRAAEKALFLKA